MAEVTGNIGWWQLIVNIMAIIGGIGAVIAIWLVLAHRREDRILADLKVDEGRDYWLGQFITFVPCVQGGGRLVLDAVVSVTGRRCPSSIAFCERRSPLPVRPSRTTASAP